jgi:hypothetical protein
MVTAAAAAYDVPCLSVQTRGRLMGSSLMKEAWTHSGISGRLLPSRRVPSIDDAVSAAQGMWPCEGMT